MSDQGERPPAQWARVKEVFGAALERAPADRAAFLDDVCGKAEVDVRHEVEALLSAHHASDTFLESPGGSPAPSTPNHRGLKEGETLGAYRVLRTLGRGGMATVYLASDPRHRRSVALKVLHPALAHALGPERFLREIEVAANLSHPHILPLFDSGQAGNLLYYVMPYVEGESLRDRLQRETHLPVEDALRIAEEVAGALAYAHGQGLIHRDIKPENILLSSGHALVADFGIARAIGQADASRLTETGMAVGTAAYMSPEQASGSDQLDGRSDLYSLGCVVYEMLAGEPPYTGPNAQAIIAKRFTDPVPSVRRLRSTVTAGVEGAIIKSLAGVPADRFASAAEFAEALRKPAPVHSHSKTIAVLPFLNLSADAENEYFADGITEDVIAQLSKIRALKVVSRSSVMPFKKRDLSLREVGAKLQAGTLLDGSVRRAGDRVRIVAQLIDAETDQHLWTETYDRQLTDIFAIQTDVSLQIAAALEAGLSPDETSRIRKEPTDDIQAYQLYLLGRHCLGGWTREGGGGRGGAVEEIDQGIKYFEQAVARDPNYALAFAALANAYTELGLGPGSGPGASEDAFRRARAAVARALELDGSLAEAHSMLAFLKFAGDYDWAGAEREFKLALALNPNSGPTCDVYGLMLSALERYDEALEMQRRAHALEPLAYRLDIATTLLRAGRNDEALHIAAQAIELDPHFVKGRVTLGWAYLRTGMPERGIAELERAVSLAPDSTLFLGQLGQALAMTGRASEARKVLRQLESWSREKYVSPYHFAYVYTGLGEHDTAMDWLERASRERAGGVYGIKGSFLFAPLRSHPRFMALLKQMNLA